jgi:hypothetical protein|tara:strand:+ start:732 stop:1397 length:666 start_codon:yes stop_codon:yes gene_type:complete
MGFLDNTSVTVDAILTKRGREILSTGGDFEITKFSLSDEEVDYTLYDVTHPNGTDYYGTVIENMNLLEATPNRTNFRSFLVNQSLAGASVKLDTLNYNQVNKLTTLALSPTTIGSPDENYTFTIENTNVVKFSNNSTARTVTAKTVELIAQSVNPGATTTVTVTGVNSGVTNIVTISVKADAASSKDPSGPQKTVKRTFQRQQQSQEQSQQEKQEGIKREV